MSTSVRQTGISEYLKGESLLSVIKCFIFLQTPPFSCYSFIISLSLSHLHLTLQLPVFCVPCEPGQVQWAMLTACPSSLAAGKTVTPVIQGYEHSMENVCMCLCVCSHETMTVWGERGFISSARNS